MNRTQWAIMIIIVVAVVAFAHFAVLNNNSFYPSSQPKLHNAISFNMSIYTKANPFIQLNGFGESTIMWGIQYGFFCNNGTVVASQITEINAGTGAVQLSNVTTELPVYRYEAVMALILYVNKAD